MLNKQGQKSKNLTLNQTQGSGQIVQHVKSIKSMMKLNAFSGLLLCVFCLSFSACKDENSKPKQAHTKVEETATNMKENKADKQVILFYGNSLTAGYGLDQTESFPSLLEDRIDSLGLDYTVVNAGLSGETTSGGLKRIDWVMKQQADILILELGANDMLRGLPIDETRKNLAEIISIVKAKNPNIKIGLCEMMAPPNMGDDYVKDSQKSTRTYLHLQTSPSFHSF